MVLLLCIVVCVVLPIGTMPRNVLLVGVPLV